MARTKRRRIADGRRAPDGSGANMGIINLPTETVIKVGEYLPKTSIALFAAALTAPSSSWRDGQWKQQPSELSKAVALSVPSWEVLDFADIDVNPKRQSARQGGGSNSDESSDSEESYEYEHTETLANILTDDDVGALLVCIDAVHTVKRLKLAGCVKITGSGLEPLRGSTVLQQIDLSLVNEHTKPEIEPAPRISQANTVPILCSIIEKEGNTLKQVQIPHKWSGFRSSLLRSQALTSFLEQYGHVLDSRPFNCSGCAPGDDCSGMSTSWINGLGMQMFTCYTCLENVCHKDVVAREDRYGRRFPRYNRCGGCDKMYCDRCNPMVYCEVCRSAASDDCFHCKDCTTEIDCDECDFEEKRYCGHHTPKPIPCKNCSRKERREVCTGFCSAPLCDDPDCFIKCDFCFGKGCGAEDCDIPMLRCENCDKANCAQCPDNDGAVRHCEWCRRQLCGDCREEEKDEALENKESFCEGCTSCLEDF